MKRRAFEVGESPSDVIKKIDDFLGDGNSLNDIMGSITDIMKGIETIENTINNLAEDKYKNEILGYITMSRQYVMSILDAVDSMMGE
jgi:hypothetical protein